MRLSVSSKFFPGIHIGERKESKREGGIRRNGMKGIGRKDRCRGKEEREDSEG
jgi:hypothetical protein